MIPGITASRRRLMSAAFDPYWDKVVALLHLDGPVGNTTVVDETGRDWINNAYPNVTLQNAHPAFGPTSGLWDKNGSTLRAENTDGAFDFGNQPFTMEAVVYMPTLGIPNAGLFSRRIGAVYSPFEFRITSAGNIEALISDPTNSTWHAIATFADVAVIPGQQNHIAVVGTGSAFQVYVRGIKSPTTIAYTSLASTAAPFYIGRGGDGGYGGYIDEVRITKGVARYAANFVPPTSQFPNQGPPAGVDPYFSNVVLLLRGEDLSDSSSYARTLTPYGSAEASPEQYKYGSKSLKIPGASQFTIPSGSELVLNDPECTIEFFIYLLSTSAKYAAVIASGRNSNGPGADLIYVGNDRRLVVGGWSFNTGGGSTTSVDQLPLNQWVHCAIVKVTTTWRIYFDGLLTAVGGGTTNLVLSYDGFTSIGRNAWDGADGYLNAYIDELRITKGVARYTEAFIPPTISFTPPTTPFPTTGP